MDRFIGIVIFIVAAVWSYRRHQHEADAAKAVLICLVFTWVPITALDKYFLDIRNEVYVMIAVLSFICYRTSDYLQQSRILHPAIGMALAVMAFSPLWAVNPADSFMRSLGVLLVFVFIWNLFKTDDGLHIVTWLSEGLLYAAYATVVVIIVKFPFTESVGFASRYQLDEEVKATGTAAMCMWAFVRLWVEGKTGKQETRILHLCMAGLVFLIMFATGTRGTMLQAALVSPFLYSLNRDTYYSSLWLQSIKHIVLLASILALILIAWSSLTANMQSNILNIYRIDREKGSINTRENTWRDAIEKAKEAPWLGRGLGSSSFYEFSDFFYRNNSSQNIPYRTTVVSQYVEIFYEFGLIGSFAFAWLFAVLGAKSIKFLQGYQGPLQMEFKTLSVYALIGLIEGLTHGGQITTGNPEIVRRWCIYCCVLMGAFANSSWHSADFRENFPPENV